MFCFRPIPLLRNLGVDVRLNIGVDSSTNKFKCYKIKLFVIDNNVD